MAKKKSIGRTVIAGTGIALIVSIGLIAVFGFGIGFDFVVPQDAEGLEIPVITPSETQQIQEIIDRISEISNTDLVDSQFCIEFTIDPEIFAFCNQLLQDALDRIKQLEMEIGEILPPPDLNNTDTSKDPPIKQICDEIIELNDGLNTAILCLPFEVRPLTISLRSLIEKTSSQGDTTFTTGEFIAIPSLAFLVEDPTNVDFSTGFIEIKTHSSPSVTRQNFEIVGTAKFDILINSQTILTDPITFEIDGRACGFQCAEPQIFCGNPITGTLDLSCSFNSEISRVSAKFVSSTGIESFSFLFNFEDNFDKFPNGLSTLEFVLTDAKFTLKEFSQTDPLIAVSEQSFGATKLVLFSMDIAKDPNQIIIDDETGGTERVFPIDSVLKVTGATTPVKAIICQLYYKLIVDCPNCRVETSLGDFNARVSPDSCLSGSIIVTFATDTARVFGLNLFDDSGNFLQSFAGGQGEVINELLPRNTNYTLTISSPTLSTDLSFPKAQQTQSYTCTNEYSITYEKVIVENLNARTGTGGYIRHTLEPVSFSVTDVICNFPE